MPICDFQKKLLLKLPRRIAALVLSVLLFLAGSGFLYAQSAPGSPLDLAGEIQSIENAIRAQNLPLQERRDNLMRLARLRQLSGDLEGAATNWLEAAIVSPGVIDPVPLLYCAFALAAMGEWERARAAIAPLLAPGFNAPELALRARFLDGFIAAVTGDTAPLAAMAANSGNGAILSEIYYVLWRTSEPAAAEAWRQRLVSRFPQSPEGRVAASSAEAAPAIAGRPSSLWLLLGRQDMPGFTPPAAQPAPAPPAAAVPRVQTGLFSQEANAQGQAAQIRAAGFPAAIERRGDLWAVVVPSAPDENETIRGLQAAGFQAFPVR